MGEKEDKGAPGSNVGSGKAEGKAFSDHAGRNRLVNTFISEREVDVEIIIDGVYRVFVERLDLEQYVRLRYI